MSLWRVLGLALAILASPMLGLAHEAHHNQRLPMIGSAPDFALISQDGLPVTLAGYRGRVVVVTFIFASCTDTCPVLTDKMARVQDKLGPAFGPKIAFVSITVDPERDTPEVLKEYAQNFGANLAGWAFLTGDPADIREVEGRYGVFATKKANGDIDHTFLTSLIDSRGILRVQYLGVRFDPEEFRSDLVGLLDKSAQP